tara:strand:+ start:28 stop:960 length:933 start_codon:yes stop_codon:yes gene_type:complete
MKVLITGGTGLVGKGIEKIKNNYDYTYIFLSSKDCDLTSYNETRLLFEREKPDYVIHLAANVGGLYKNMNYKVDMLEKNVTMNSNVLKCSHEIGVKKLIAVLSTCIFPDKTTYPIDEEMLHNGPPHHSNDAYAYAKRLLEIHCRAYREQYNDNFVCVIPTNIYGEYDNYSLENGHVIPSLIHKCYLAKKNSKDFIVLGSGKPLRQFIYSMDCAKLIMWVLENYKDKDSLILSPDESDEISIGDVAKKIAECYNYSDRMVFDNKFSDGQYKKTANNEKLKNLYGNLNLIQIEKGIEKSVNWFIDNYENARK